MTTAKKGFRDRQFHYEKTTVVIDGSGNGTTTITWDTAYQTTPVGVVIPPLGTAGTWTLASLSTTGCILTAALVTDLASMTVEVAYFVHEKL